MGLKTTNYVSKSKGLTLSTAYAKIKDLVLNGNKGRAIFAIHSTRDAIDKHDPVEKVEVYFTWDRKTNIAKAAYDAAKTEIRTVEEFNEETGEPVTVTKNGTLYGWEDDYIAVAEEETPSVAEAVTVEEAVVKEEKVGLLQRLFGSKKTE